MGNNDNFKKLLGKLLGGGKEEHDKMQAAKQSMLDVTVEIRASASLLHRLLSTVACPCPECKQIAKIGRDFADSEAFNKLNTHAKKHFLSALLVAERDLEYAIKVDAVNEQFNDTDSGGPASPYGIEPSNN
jgi:hypothetical protein